MGDPYAPPRSRDATPPVLFWYRVYCTCMGAVHLAYALVTTFSGFDPTPSSLVVVALTGSIAGFFALAAIVPRAPWGWTVGLVAIALGLPSPTVVVAVPLLLRWRSPILKAAFRRL